LFGNCLHEIVGVIDIWFKCVWSYSIVAKLLILGMEDFIYRKFYLAWFCGLRIYLQKLSFWELKFCGCTFILQWA